MIKKLTIKNYKSFQDFTLDNIAPITLIGGKNNTGKSSLLESIFLFYGRLQADLILRQLGWRGTKTLPVKPELLWGPAFTNYNMNNPILLSLQDEDSIQTVSIAFEPQFSFNAVPSGPEILPKQINIDQPPVQSFALRITGTENNKEIFSHHIFPGISGLELRINIPDSRTGKSRRVVYLSDKTMDNNENIQRFGELDIQGKQDALLENLRIIEPKLKSISNIALGEFSILHGDVGIGRKIPINYMGDGLSRILSILLAVYTSPNGIVLIDEIENGFHYSTLPDIWKTLRKASQDCNCQILATTHSMESIRTASEVFKNSQKEFSFIRIDKSPSPEAVHYPVEILQAALGNNWEVR